MRGKLTYFVYGAAIVVVLVSVVPLTSGDANTDLNTLQDDFWEFRMFHNPTLSSYLGQYANNDLMMSYDIKQFATKRSAPAYGSGRWGKSESFRRQNRTVEFLRRLDAVDNVALDGAGRVNHVILRDSLQTFLEGNNWAMYGALSPVTFLSGIQVYDPPTMAATNTLGDYQNYIARLHAVQTQVDELKDSMRTAIAINRTLHNVSMARVPEQIDALIFDNLEDSPEFGQQLNDSHIPRSDRSAIRQQGREAVEAYINAMKDLKRFIVDEYMPATRREYGVHAWDPSHAYYRECIKWHLSFAMSPEEVHRKGRSEVARISNLMHQIMAKLKFAGSVRGFFASLHGDSRFYTNDTAVLLKAYTDTVFNRIQPKLADLFRDIPNVPLEIRASTSDNLGGGYSVASDNQAGVFYINLFRPMEVPFFEMMALSLHESIPGHHLQHSYSMFAHLPAFRKHTILNFNVLPNWFPFYSAYEEGWALYCEYLGEEMGLYKDEYEMMGRYSYEILRASRLVVDTGIHYYGWSREKAIDFLTNHTALQEGGAANEIDRYITWPGQACAYKIGELKIKDLRHKAEKELGSSFEIRDFHHVILQNGAMSMAVLETTVADWIAERKAITTSSTVGVTYQTIECPVTSSHSDGSSGTCIFATNAIVLLSIVSTIVNS